MAARFFVNGGVDNNWGTSGNWSTSSGGAGGAGVPTTADDVTFDTNSPNCTINASARVCKTMTASAYTNTLTFSQTLTVSGNVTLGASLTFAGASALRVDTTGTLTSNGKTVSVPMSFLGNSQTYTLADAWTISGLITFGNGSGALTLNGNTLNATGSVTTAVNSVVSGTTTLVFAGTGTWSSTWVSGAGGVTLTTSVNTVGTLTISGTVIYTGTFTYVAGTVVTTGSTFAIRGASAITSGSIVWATVSYIGSGTTTTLNDAMVLTGDFLLSTASANVIWNGFSVTVPGNFTLALTRLSGTTKIILTGSGTFGASGAGVSLANPVDINTTGTVVTSWAPLTIASGCVITVVAGHTSGSLVAGMAVAAPGGAYAFAG